MLWRNLVYAIIFGIMLTLPLHGKALNEDPCNKLARGLSLLGAESIHYHGYYFISTVGQEKLARKFESMSASLNKFPVDWRLGSGLDDTYTVLKVSGSDYRECREFADSLTGAAGQDKGLLGQTWHLESYVKCQKGDLVALGLQLLESLGGELYSIRVYNNTVYLLAYVPWPGDVLMLEDGSVNLNLELLFEPITGSIRLRAGIPVLLSFSHFEY